jgi:2-iminobutanoate/2-iminopropanoate deaminase
MTHPLVSYPRNADTPASHLPFSPAVVVGELIFVSGQASVDANGKIVGDSFEGEFRRSVENLRKVLEAAGSDLAHVVQTRNYVRDAEDVPRYNELYREYFTEPFPTRTTITNCLPPALRYEIEAVAVKRPA